VKLTKVRRRLAQRGDAIPYATLHRFAREELGYGKPRATVAVADGEPGVELQVDTAWLPLVLEDERGRRRRLRVWNFTPSVSRYRFVYPCFDGSTASAIEACEAAWSFYGGVFRALIPDNTKAIVSGYDPHEPRIAQGFLEYAQSRGFVIDAARVRRPTDKARVERSVQYVRDDCFGGETLRDLAHAREHALAWCEGIAGLRAHSRTLRMPREHFDAVERSALLPAPRAPYDVPHWCEPKVGIDHYAQVLRALYSLPTKYIGKRVVARADSLTVRFYERGVLIKTHPRKPPGSRSTDVNDFPDDSGVIAGRTTDWLVERGRKLGVHVGELTDIVLAGRSRGRGCDACTCCTASPRSTARRVSMRRARSRSSSVCTTSSAWNGCSSAACEAPRSSRPIVPLRQRASCARRASTRSRRCVQRTTPKERRHEHRDDRQRPACALAPAEAGQAARHDARAACARPAAEDAASGLPRDAALRRGLASRRQRRHRASAARAPRAGHADRALGRDREGLLRDRSLYELYPGW
jgi:hypothetical protein